MALSTHPGRFLVLKSGQRRSRMKTTALAIVTLVLTAVGAGPVLAQTMAPPVTMQPIPNPPEKAKAPGHKAKHHTAAAAKPADAPAK